ncbi:hypothetical protein ACXYRR_03955, partial [Mycoplasma sp. 246B]
FNYKPLRELVNNPKITIIMLENPPFAEPTGETTRSKTSFKIKDIWLRQKMIQTIKEEKIKVNSQAYANDLANIFIFSAFKWYLRQQTDSYILFSPIKYWKVQHLIDKEILDSVLCNKNKFNASKAAISLIHWKNIDKENKEINFRVDEQEYHNINQITVKKVFNNINNIFEKEDESDGLYDVIIVSSQWTPDFKHGYIINQSVNIHATFRKYTIENAYKYLPLWIANEYKTKHFYEIDVLMKSSDKKDLYQKDERFLFESFIYTLFSFRNQCISNETMQNNFVPKQGSRAQIFLDELKKKFNLNDDEKDLFEIWNSILVLITKCDEYKQDWKYGSHQIEKQLNIKIESGSYTKDNKPIMKPKYSELDEKLKLLKQKISEYFNKFLTPKILEYELIK